MKATVNKDSKYLIANSDHKNFTETNEVIEEGSVLEGDVKNVEGLRRGEPFTYRLFITKEGKILYLNNVTPMKTVEVTLGADSQRTPTTVDLIPAETFTKMKTYGIVAGGLVGFAYAKYKKKDMKRVAMFIAVGAVVGYAAGYVLDRNRKVIVTQSK